MAKEAPKRVHRKNTDKSKVVNNLLFMFPTSLFIVEPMTGDMPAPQAFFQNHSQVVAL
jgi:hypothetical protein